VQASNDSLKKMSVFNWAGMAMAHVAHKLNANTLAGSRRNISAHYDAGNDMYKL
jgi:cyclopropane-fatty-acyl-phospholipid synthase